jgi:hypothetical protein
MSPCPRLAKGWDAFAPLPQCRAFAIRLTLAGEHFAYSAMAASSCEAAMNAIALIAEDPAAGQGFAVSVSPL